MLRVPRYLVLAGVACLSARPAHCESSIQVSADKPMILHLAVDLASGRWKVKVVSTTDPTLAREHHPDVYLARASDLLELRPGTRYRITCLERGDGEAFGFSLHEAGSRHYLGLIATIAHVGGPDDEGVVAHWSATHFSLDDGKADVTPDQYPAGRNLFESKAAVEKDKDRTFLNQVLEVDALKAGDLKIKGSSFNISIWPAGRP